MRRVHPSLDPAKRVPEIIDLMVGEFKQTPVDPATADRSLWKRYHELRRVRQQELRPEDPVVPDDLEEQVMKREDPFRIQHRYEVSNDGVMLSWLYSDLVRPGTPEWESNKQFFEADIYVRPDHRGQGIGASWFPLINQLMERHGCTILSLYTEAGVGHEFLKWLGADEKLSEIENRLNLAELDWAMVERWAADGPARSPHTKLEIYDANLPESMWEDFAPQYSALINTIPFEQLEHGDIIVTPDQMREYFARQEIRGEVQHTVLAREPDGSISGITDVIWAPYRPAVVHQQLTGVRPDARGRGLGKWIKAAMLLRIRDLHPDVQWIATENAGSNEPMLAINHKLGFKQHRVGTAYQMTRERLETRLKELSN
jgi:GNAT superfamily N-acetyltransferase